MAQYLPSNVSAIKSIPSSVLGKFNFLFKSSLTSLSSQTFFNLVWYCGAV
jgi:hypothetical protein